MKTKNVIALIACLLILVFTIILYHEIYRGYGILGGYNRFFVRPEFQIANGISRIAAVVEDTDYDDSIPEIYVIVSKEKKIKLKKQQPYCRLGISIVEYEGSRNKTYDYLFASMPILEDEMFSFKENKISSIIYISSIGKWDESRELYRPDYGYPERIESKLEHKWAFGSSMIYGSLESAYPPIPGCIVVADDVLGKNAEILYPRNLLQIMEMIYPRVKIPEDKIIDIPFSQAIVNTN